MSTQKLYSILIVDDNPNNLFTLRALLETSLNAEVIEAQSGFDALERVSESPIDLILLDIQMPDLNGFDVARLIRNRPKFANIPIIFLTAVYKSEDFKQQGFESGAIDYLTKPIDDTILITRVKAYLRVIEAERESNRRLSALNARLQAEIDARKRAEAPTRRTKKGFLFRCALIDVLMMEVGLHWGVPRGTRSFLPGGQVRRVLFFRLGVAGGRRFPCALSSGSPR